MTLRKPLDPFSEVVNKNRRWTPDWYSWLLDLTREVQIGGGTQRFVSSSPVSVLSTDSIISVNINTGTPSCTLPLAASREGAPITIKDVGGHFGTHNFTISGSGGETIDGLASITLIQNRQAVTLNPFSDGVNSGWFIT